MIYRILLIFIIVSASILNSCDEKPTGPVELKITSITPDSGYVGDTITITGTSFGLNQDTSYVSFPFAKGSKIISWSNTEIKLKVPAGAKSGRVSVIVNDEISNEVDFIVKIEFQVSAVTDIDGNIYKTVKIGNQWWMAENLNVSHYRNGDSIPQVTDSLEWAHFQKGAWCYYNNDPTLGVIYDKLYNWYAVNDQRGLAPEGWHIATDEEWTELSDCLGGDAIAGGKLKTTGTIEAGDGLWLRPNRDATNESGFSALPGGYRGYHSAFFDIGGYGYWWSSTDYHTTLAWYIFLIYNSSDLSRVNDDGKSYGMAVRCIKN